MTTTYERSAIDSRYAWFRLAATLLISTIGNVGMWSVVVVLPAVQAEFGTARAEASLPYTLTMVCFGLGGILMGRAADRIGIVAPVIIGALALGAGYIAAGYSTSILQFALAHGLLIGLFGSGALFGPLIADISHWFQRRRGLAVAVCASGNYFAGAIWPPIVQHMAATIGWRHAYIAIGFVTMLSLVPLALALRRRLPAHELSAAEAAAVERQSAVPAMSPATLQTLLMIAGVACCVAMSMPQVHLVAYCVDLGYGAARGAEMLSLMLGFGIVSRLASGWICDRIGGFATLLTGSVLQALALLFYVPFDGLTSLYIVSAMFGLVQGGIVPSYAIIVRDQFAPSEAGARVGIVLMATLIGMALGGWMSGAVYDYTGSYQAAFINGFAWNLLNIGIVLWLMHKLRRNLAYA
ncbi:MAG: MFS transporter [Bacteroidota bacterium]